MTTFINKTPCIQNLLLKVNNMNNILFQNIKHVKHQFCFYMVNNSQIITLILYYYMNYETNMDVHSHPCLKRLKIKQCSSTDQRQNNHRAI